MLANKAKTRVPTAAQPSPTGIGNEGNIFTKARNRSSGSNGAEPSNQKVFVSQRASLNTKNSSSNNATSAAKQYHSPDGTVSSESKRTVMVMQPNIVKKQMMTNYSREHSAENAKDYHSPDMQQLTAGQQQQISLRGKKKAVTQLVANSSQQSKQSTNQTSKRQKSSHRQTNQTQPACNSSIAYVQTEMSGTKHQQAPAPKIKIKKRGHSENMHTDGSSQRTTNAFLMINSQTPADGNQKSSSHMRGAKSNHFQQRGSSLMQPSTASINEVNKKLEALKQTQQQEASSAER